MDGEQADLLRVHSLLAAANEAVERLIAAGSERMTDAEKLLTATAIQLARTIDPKSLAEGIRWAEAYQAGDEAWAILRSVPGDNATVTYIGHLSREQRAVFGR